MIRILNFRAVPCVLKQLRSSGSSSQAATQAVTSTLCSAERDKSAEQHDSSQVQEKKNDQKVPKIKGNLVVAAFEQLKALDHVVDINDSVIKMITEAKDVEGLLSVVSVKKLNRKHALKLVSVLADWTVEGKIETADFEKDPRFIAICQILGSNIKGSQQTKSPQAKDNTDLLTVLGVASDDEAAKLISNISLTQMIKVLSTLASKKRRSLPLLRSLAFNIASSSEKLDIKQGADALYAAASLNYHDEMLVDKICSDLCICLMDNSRRAVVGSIITSLGLLRFKHIDLLNLLSEWVLKHKETCNPHDIISLVMTLAVVNHTPSNEDALFPLVLEHLNASGVPNPQDWLDLVWALTVLNKQTTDLVASVLSPDFADKLRTINTDGLTVPTKLKLLNINSVARLRLKHYDGSLLDLSSEEWQVPLLRSKEKQALVTAVHETMLNVLPSAIYLSTNIQTDMGFILDAECLMSKQMAPLPLLDKKTKAPIDRSGPDIQKGIKVGILVNDYHDMTRGRREPTGINVLYQELIRLKGYRVMTVDYIDFNPRNKLVNNVQYLNQQLKAALGRS